MKKVLALMLTSAMIVTTFVGCGNSAAATAPAATTAEEAAPEEEAAVDSTAEESVEETTAETAAEDVYDHTALENAGDITLTMMLSGTETEDDFDTKILPELVKAKWPNVTLEVTKLPDDNYYTALKTKLASGECPDMILVQPKYAGANGCYNLASAGYLAPLNDMDCMSKIGNLSESFTLDSQIYGIANGVSILGTYYNKDMFDQYGLKEPTTWDEFLNVCQTLKDNDIQPITMGDKDQYVLQFGLYQLAAAEIYSENAAYDDGLYTGETAFTDAGTWDHVLEMYAELYDKGYIDGAASMGTGSSQAIQQFIDGEAAMTFDGSFNVTALCAEGTAGDFARGYFPLPGDKGVLTAEICAGAGPAISANSKYINECKELLDYWYNGESEIWDAYVATGKYTVTYGNGSDSLNALFTPFVDLMDAGQGYYWCNQAWPSGVAEEMEALFYEHVGGQGTTIEDVTKGMQFKFEDLSEE